MAAYTGALRGELLNLRWADVDLDKPQIHVTGTAAVIDRQRVEGTTKSGRSRVVSLAPTTVKVLKAHRARQDEDRLKVGEAWRGSAYVFTTGWGDPPFPDTPSHLMPKLIETHNKQNPKTPLPHVRLHDLRHIHATTLLLAGVPVHVVAARLGHADPAITTPGLRPRHHRASGDRRGRLRRSTQKHGLMSCAKRALHVQGTLSNLPDRCRGHSMIAMSVFSR
ncbi:site-specific integrase [Nonomuraea indica]|uniref:site-specific integrase n=1 Tax=Nonomuraea indica TaxID=1581193 RepID=UPI003CCC0FA6